MSRLSLMDSVPIKWILNIPRAFSNGLRKTFEIFMKCAKRICKFLEHKDREGTPVPTRPTTETIMLSFFVLLLFLIGAIIALRNHTDTVLWAIIATNTVLVACLGAVFLYDVFVYTPPPTPPLATGENFELHERTQTETTQTTTQPKKRKYSQNRANSVLTVILSITVMTAMYSRIWYQKMIDVVVRMETDTVTAPRFPAVTFFQRTQHSQANIFPSDLKCISGLQSDDSVPCSALSLHEAMQTQSCDCGDSWPSTERLERGGNDVKWLGHDTAYLSFVPSETTVSKGSGHFLALQVFFNYNTTESFQNQSLVTAPGLWMAMYDPTISLGEAISGGAMYTAQLDANSHTVANLGIRYYHYLDKKPKYIYDVTLSARPNIGLVCDVNVDYWYLCHFTFEIQYPSLLRTTVKEEHSYQWSQVVAEAGAYYALVQSACWILSGIAFS